MHMSDPTPPPLPFSSSSVGSSQGTLPSTNLCVDLFTLSNWKRFQQSELQQGCELIFFLSHLHTDHTVGLNHSWKLGTIYTSYASKSLLLSKYCLDPSLVVGLPLHRPHRMAWNRAGTEVGWVTLIDASTHCPGAVMFLFEGYFGRILYTGDIRFDSQCEENLCRFGRSYSILKDQHISRPIIGVNNTTQQRNRKSSAKRESECMSEDKGGISRLLMEKSDSPCDGDLQAANDRILQEEQLQQLEEPDLNLMNASGAAASAHSSSPTSCGILGEIDCLYLDNTFCHPRYARFNDTTTTVDAMHAIIQQHHGCDILLAGDSLGKEDMLVLLSYYTQTKVVVPESRWKMLAAIAKAGLALNTDVDINDIKRFAGASAATNVADNVPGCSSSPPFVSPLSNPRLWFPCFSPRPEDGFIKLGPKNQVTRQSIEWMNSLVTTQTNRSMKRKQQRPFQSPLQQLPKPHTESANQSDQPITSKVIAPAEHKDDAGQCAMECASDEGRADDDLDEYDANENSEDSDLDSSSDEDPYEQQTDPFASGSAVQNEMQFLTRPVVGIAPTGWSVDRSKQGSGATGAADRAAEEVLPTAETATAKCMGPGPGNCQLHLLPYSSHSSYSQLRRFVSLLRPHAVRSLSKGSCNTAHLHDLLHPNAQVKPIVIPHTMTHSIMQPMRSAAEEELHRQRLEQHVKAVEDSVMRTTSNFADLASSIHRGVAAKRSHIADPSVSSPPAPLSIAPNKKRAMQIGLHEMPEEMDISNEQKERSMPIIIDAHVDLTDSLPSSMPDLEDFNGNIKLESKVRQSGRSSPILVSHGGLNTHGGLATERTRVRSWLDVFEVFELYPHVPIEGLQVPEPSLAHLKSYPYGREILAQRAASNTKVTGAAANGKRKLPKFLLEEEERELVPHARPMSAETLEVMKRVEAVLHATSGISPSGPTTASSFYRPRFIDEPATDSQLSSLPPPSLAAVVKLEHSVSSGSKPKHSPAAPLGPERVAKLEGGSPSVNSSSSPPAHQPYHRTQRVQNLKEQPNRRAVNSEAGHKTSNSISLIDEASTTSAAHVKKKQKKWGLPSYMGGESIADLKPSKLNNSQSRAIQPVAAVAGDTVDLTADGVIREKKPTINKKPRSVLSIDCSYTIELLSQSQ